MKSFVVTVREIYEVKARVAAPNAEAAIRHVKNGGGEFFGNITFVRSLSPADWTVEEVEGSQEKNTKA
jgi:hypothetical protein